MAWDWLQPLWRGFVGASGNELTVAGRDEDPPALRLGAKEGDSLGKLSFGRLFGQEPGQTKEYVLVQGKLEHNRGLFRLDVTKNGGHEDEDMTPVFEMTAHGAEFYVPVTAPGGVQATADRLVSANRRFRLHMQNDGNLVIYDDVTQKPIWDSGTWDAVTK